MTHVSTKLLAFALFTTFAACGDAPANPSDISAAGTSLAVLSSSNLDEEFDDFVSGDGTGQVTTNNGVANNGSANNGTGNPYPFELDCTASISLSGPISGSFQNNGCAGSAVGVANFSLSWLFGDIDNIGEGLAISDVAKRPGGALGEFEADTIYQRPGDTTDKGWIGRCTVSLTSNAPYTDANGQSRAVWAGSIACSEPLAPHTRPSNEFSADWVADETGEALTIESFTFETPYPFS